MSIDFETVLQILDQAFSQLESSIEKPVRVPYRDHFIYKYEDEGIKQAMVQKLARIVTGLRSTTLLLEAGFFQEMAVLQRIVDELHEDILFLGYAILSGSMTKLHKEYLEGFYTEILVDSEADVPRIQTKRKVVRRKEISDYIDRADAELSNQPTPTIPTSQLTHELGTIYSGFVHAGSPQIMSMYGGYQPHYHLQGMLNTPLYADHKQDLWNQFYRGLLSHIWVAMIFRNAELEAALVQFQKKVEQSMRME